MNRSLRVLYLAPRGRHPDQLSVRSFVDEEIRALADAGIEAFVLGQTGGHDKDIGRIHVRGIPPDTLARRWEVGRFAIAQLTHLPVRNLADMRQCYRAARIECFASELIRREQIDVIHSHFGYPRGLGGLLARADTGKPLVAHLRGHDISSNRAVHYGARLDPWFDRTIRCLLQGADATVFVSDFLRREAARLGARPEVSAVIQQGVRVDQFRPVVNKVELRRSLGTGSGPLLLVVAGLIPIKGVHQILESLARLRAHPFSLVICGDGPQRKALEESSRKLGLLERTRFVGRVPRAEIARYFGAADVFLHGSLMESAGYALLEAMAAGLPVVCTDSGGPSEYVEDGVAGFVVPVADPPAMAEKILMLLRDGALRQRLGRQARERVETQFRYERMIRETMAKYLSVTQLCQ